MIRLNFATKPGLQPEEEIEFPPSSLLPETGNTASTKPTERDFVTPQKGDKDIFAAAEKQLENLEQSEEEFIPHHVSLPPKKERFGEERIETSEEKSKRFADEAGVEKLVRKTRRQKILKVFFYIIILAAIGYGGFYLYQNYFKGVIQLPFFANKEHVSEITPDTSTTGYALNKSEINQPTSAPSATAAYEQPLVNQLSEEATHQVMMSEFYLTKFAQLFDLLPSDVRIQYFKLNMNRVSFIIYLNNSEDAQRLRSNILSSGDYESPEIFYIEPVTNRVQITSIVNIKEPQFTSLKSYRYLADTEINQLVWTNGRNNQLDIQPLQIYAASPTQPHRADIKARGLSNNCVAFLRTLAGLNLNSRVENLIMKPAANLTDPNNLEFTITILIYPQTS